MFDPQAMNRFVRMLPRTSDRHQHKHRVHGGGAEGGCGKCPSCGEVVVIERLEEGAGAACPKCGQVVKDLIPLGDGLGDWAQ